MAFTLAEGATHVAMSKNIRKCAFTLAEVLITLGIIGVVAALTLPTLIANYQKQVYVNKLKKMVSTIENGLRQASADEGVAINQTELFTELTTVYCVYNGLCPNKYDTIKKYFKVTGKDEVQHQKDCMNNNNFTCPIDIEGAIYFMDGSTTNYDSGPELGIDINGNGKPNELGRDYFAFQIDQNGILLDSDDCDWEYTNGGGFTTRVQSHPKNCGKCESNSDPSKCFFYRIQKDGWKMNY